MYIFLIAITILLTLVNCSKSSVSGFRNSVSPRFSVLNRLPSIYNEFPEPYMYDNSIDTYVLDNPHDCENLIQNLLNVYDTYNPKNIYLVPYWNFDYILKSNLVSIFVESYPTLIHVPISLIDFWYLTLFAISQSSVPIKFPDYDHLKRVVACLTQDDYANRFLQPDYVSQKLNSWISYMTSVGYKLNSYYCFEVSFSYLKSRGLDKSTLLCNVFSIASFPKPEPIIFRFLELINEEAEIYSYEAVKVLVDSFKDISEFTKVLMSKQFHDKFTGYGSCLKNAFELFFRKTFKSRQFNTFRKFILFSKALNSSDAEIFFEIFVQFNSEFLKGFDFDSVIPTKSNSVSLFSENSAVFQFENVRILNWPKYLIMTSIIVFYDAQKHVILLETLVNHHQIDTHEFLRIALEYSTDVSVFRKICENVYDLAPMIDMNLWDSLRSKLAQLEKFYIVKEIMNRPNASVIDILFFPAVVVPRGSEDTYNGWIQNLHLETPRTEVRIEYSNSYNIINSFFNQKIFGELYPLSLALVLGNEQAAKALGRLGNQLSKEHWNQALEIANVYGFNTKTFYEIRKESERNCIIS